MTYGEDCQFCGEPVCEGECQPGLKDDADLDMDDDDDDEDDE